MPRMRSNGYHLANNAATISTTQPLRDQISKISKHKGKMERRLAKLERLPHVAADSNQVGARTPDIELKIMDLRKRITQAEFQIFAIKSKIKNPQFNRNSVPRERSIQPDRGKILYSKNGRYDTSDHKGVQDRKRPDDTIVIEVP